MKKSKKLTFSSGGPGLEVWLSVLGAAAVCLCFLVGGWAILTPQNSPKPEAAALPTTAPTEESLPVQTLPEAEEIPWHLLLVNPWNPVPQDHCVELTQLQNDQAIDKRVYPDLQRMMDDLRGEGLSPLICSSYRTEEKQQTLFANKVNQYLAAGFTQAEAEAEAGKVVAVPGTSEHQLGLAVDIMDTNYPYLDREQENTAVQKWLMENSWRYGFVLRYPNGKSHITGIDYEPWHYRYVGTEAAREIYETGVCFEEYWQARYPAPSEPGNGR